MKSLLFLVGLTLSANAIALPYVTPVAPLSKEHLGSNNKLFACSGVIAETAEELPTISILASKDTQAFTQYVNEMLKTNILKVAEVQISGQTGSTSAKQGLVSVQNGSGVQILCDQVQSF